MRTRLRTPKRRPDMRKAVFLFPSGLTLLNLFFGIFAIIAASRLEFVTAGVYVVIGGICDALDGRVARATNAGTQFGEELDSLVDAITFGLAPGMIMYYAVLNRGGWDWVWVFAFAAAAVLRLARFNIEQAGSAKTYFQGLPSPAAGITLASYYWFSESWLYSYGRIANLNWHVALRFLMAVLAALMISNVPYPTFPRTGFRSVRAIGSSIIVFGAVGLLLSGKLEYFFPLALLYVSFGLLRWLFAGLFERRQPTLPYDLSEGEDDEDEDEDEDEEDDEFDLVGSRGYATRPSARDEAAARPERVRGRLDRPERAERAPEPRADRGTRKHERSPRPERTERPAVTERSAEDERARRERKKDRPKRTDRPERPPRPSKPEVASPSPLAASAAPAVAGVNAITVGPPDAVSARDDGELDVEDGDESAEPTGVDAITVGQSDGGEGAPPRKRKRRRRRGERKERTAGDTSGPRTSETGGSDATGTPVQTEGEASAAPRPEADHSPYAEASSAYAPPTPPPAPIVPPPVPPSSNEPSE
jgi:CDP-diacylglycerol--serine O-phosphatidyltransferase